MLSSSLFLSSNLFQFRVEMAGRVERVARVASVAWSLLLTRLEPPAPPPPRYDRNTVFLLLFLAEIPPLSMRGCSKLEPTGLRALEQAEMPQLEEVLLDDEVESEQVPGQFKELMLVVCWSFVGRLLVLFGVPFSRNQ